MIKWMYEKDRKVDEDLSEDQPEHVDVFQCPKCGLKLRVITDAHDDFICDCGYEMILGVHNIPLEETDFDKLLEERNFNEDDFKEAVDKIATFLDKTTSPTYGAGKLWARYNVWKRLSDNPNRTIYCPACLKYGMESQDEYNPVCPVCGANAQWEDEVTLCVKGD